MGSPLTVRGLQRHRWEARLHREEMGTPLVPPHLVLEQAGLAYVAATAGGLAAWRCLGPDTTHGEPAPVTPVHPGTTDPRGPLTHAELEAHIEDPRTVRWPSLVFILAKGLPVQDVRFRSDGSFTVTDAR